jgi:hypothetical protein
MFYSYKPKGLPMNFEKHTPTQLNEHVENQESFDVGFDVIHTFNMTSAILKQIDADIAAEEASIKSALAASNTKIAKLRAAREVVSGYGDIQQDESEGIARISLADKIENVILDRGPSDAGSIYSALEAAGHSTTANAVSTTLSRMKGVDRMTNENGQWDFTARRRKALFK